MKRYPTVEELATKHALEKRLQRKEESIIKFEQDRIRKEEEETATQAILAYEEAKRLR